MKLAPHIWNRIHGLVAALVTIVFPFLLTLIAFYWQWDVFATNWVAVRFIAWLGSMLAFLWFLLVLGYTVKRKLLGILLNERNRYSLSRLQMLLWSLLILPSLYVILLNNVYQRTGDASFAFDWQLLALMGISVTSVVSTPLILSRKSDTVSAPTAAAAAAGATASAGALDANLEPEQANLTELVMGEELSNQKTIDIGRIQMLLVSLIVVVIYGCLIGGTLLDTPLFIAKFPDLGTTLLGLVAVSNAGYLVGKVTPSANSRSATAEQLARALQLSQKVTDLVRRAEQAEKDAVPGGARGKQISDLLSLARSLAADAGSLPTLAGTEKFDSDAVSRLEGKYEALAGQFGVVTGATGTDAVDAPKPDVVSDVQRKLVTLGNTAVSISGVADAPTMKAIDGLLMDRAMTRADLSPEPYRLFEELQAMLA